MNILVCVDWLCCNIVQSNLLVNFKYLIFLFTSVCVHMDAVHMEARAWNRNQCFRKL